MNYHLIVKTWTLMSSINGGYSEIKSPITINESKKQSLTKEFYFLTN